MAFDINSFIDKFKDQLSPEEVQEARAGYLRNDDYQRTMNRLKLEHQQRIAAEDEYHNQLAAHDEEFRRQQETLAQLEQRLGVPVDQLVRGANPNVLQSPVTGEVVRLADVQKMIAESNAALLAQIGPAVAGTFHLAKRMPFYVTDYQETYKKRFDADAFQLFCEQNNISDSDLGYKLFTANDEAERLKKKHEDELKQAREEGERSALSRHHIPDSYGRPSMRSPLMRQPNPTAPIQQPVQAAPVPAAPVPAAPSIVDQVNASAGDLAVRMQQKFEAAKDK